jgi:tetratricopeptide (TPR) repeat protein
VISGEKIAQYISQPQTVEKDNLSDLGALVKKYPYSSSFHLLELKGLALANSIDFEEKLKSTAIHAPDRGHLYEFIHSGIETAEKEAVNDLPVTDTKVDKALEIAVEETSVQEDIETSEPIIQNAKEEIKSEAETNQPKVETTEKVEESTSETTSDLEDSNNKNELSELDVDILNKAIDIAFVSSEIAPENPIEEVEEKELEAIEKEVPPEEEITVEAALNVAPEEPIDRADLTFIQWLRIKQERNKSLAKTEGKEGVAAIEETEDAPAETIKTIEKEAPKQDNRKKEIDALLDKFMAEEPRISKPVKDFYNPVKSAQKSVEESDDMVTETLAKIHVLQKNYSKAISAYEKLILLYPEKKTFFASRIEKIREESKKR